MNQLSVNSLALELVEELRLTPYYYGVGIQEEAPIIIDAGVEAKGGFQAGKIITEICMGDLGQADITYKEYGDLQLPSIMVCTDYPSIATLGSQLAGWRIQEGDYSAIGSGPGRALALKPKDVYQQIGYQDSCDQAVIVLETDDYPPAEVSQKLADECEVSLEDLTLILTPTSSIAGSTQISGRIVETGIHKLTEIGLDPKVILHACGYAPISPLHPEFVHSMARTNDAILYGGVAYYTVNHPDDQELERLVEEAPSESSSDYGKPFLEIFKEADYDFYNIDNELFAPAVLTINNIKTGNTFTSGKINAPILKQSLGL
ncbi:MAG: methenyltetrahydromethanopterin cyclohydrolase [Thermoproteota archaeon]